MDQRLLLCGSARRPGTSLGNLRSALCFVITGVGLAVLGRLGSGDGIDDLHCPVVQVVRLSQRQLNYWRSSRSPLLLSFFPHVVLPIFARSYTPCIAHPRTPSPNRNLPHLDQLCLYDVPSPRTPQDARISSD